MPVNKHPIDVGIPKSGLNTSPIFLNIDDERELIEAEIPEERSCYFNGERYPHGCSVKSSASIFKCDRGAWVEVDVAD